MEELDRAHLRDHAESGRMSIPVLKKCTAHTLILCEIRRSRLASNIGAIGQDLISLRLLVLSFLPPFLALDNHPSLHHHHQEFPSQILCWLTSFVGVQ